MNGYTCVLHNSIEIDTTNKDCSMNCLFKMMNEIFLGFECSKLIKNALFVFYL